VRQVIDVREARRLRAARGLHGHEVDVVDRALAVAIDQVDETAADTFDRRDLQLHRSDARLDRLRAQVDAMLVRSGSVLHAERHRTRRRPVLAREALTEAVRLGIDDEVDVTLPMQRDVLAAMPRRDRKAEALEQSAQQLRIGCGVLDELEAVGADGIAGGVHGRIPLSNGYN